MGAADTVTKAYMRENVIFADAFNYLIYDGEPVIEPEKLKELDATEIASPFGNGDTEEAVQKYRDILKSAVIMQDEKASYVLLGIENQTDIHYAMPVRNMIYDALQYGKQVSDVSTRHRKASEKPQTRGEYLSGFYKKDKIVPVITLVVHFGADAWDGARSLHKMMDIRDEKLLRFIPDYKIQLIDPAGLSAEDLNKLSTSLREVMGYIKYSRSKEKLSAFLNQNPREWIEANAARVIKAITKTPIEIPEGAEEINVCEAIEAMMKDSRNEGKIEALAGLVKDGLLSMQDAAARLDMSVADFEAAIKKLA